jgi:FKBP-type peptidyl-prolyl cis-trans isomerase FkpA
VHYTGWLTDGEVRFQQGSQRPLRLPLGARHVISGWDEGVQGMKVGGRRKLTIPPNLGYGARGAGGVIPQRHPGVRSGAAGGEVIHALCRIK